MLELRRPDNRSPARRASFLIKRLQAAVAETRIRFTVWVLLIVIEQSIRSGFCIRIIGIGDSQIKASSKRTLVKSLTITFVKWSADIWYEPCTFSALFITLRNQSRDSWVRKCSRELCRSKPCTIDNVQLIGAPVRANYQLSVSTYRLIRF